MSLVERRYEGYGRLIVVTEASPLRHSIRTDRLMSMSICYELGHGLFLRLLLVGSTLDGKGDPTSRAGVFQGNDRIGIFHFLILCRKLDRSKR